MKGVVAVIDAADVAGRGVVEAALRAGRPVVAVSPDTAELARLRKLSGDADLTAIRGSIADESACAALAVALRDIDRPVEGIVIATSGDPIGGRVLDHSVETFQRRLQTDLFPQLTAARSLLPLLTYWGRSGGYVVIGSPGAEHPWSGYSYCSIAAAAMSMLVRVLHEEARSLAVRVQLLAVKRPIRTTENPGACEHWPDALAIGEQALALIDRLDPRTADEAVVKFVSRSVSPSSQSPLGTRHVDAGDQTALEETWRALEPIFNSIPKAGSK
jgi:NAD(P)-dependent dehydrogenase (short-subunit alcohol dehydrogenase family)